MGAVTAPPFMDAKLHGNQGITHAISLGLCAIETGGFGLIALDATLAARHTARLGPFSHLTLVHLLLELVGGRQAHHLRLVVPVVVLGR